MSRLKLNIGALSLLTLSACVVAPYQRPGVAARGYYPADLVVVDVAPPAPYVEVVPVMPYPGSVWIGGYWGWYGGRHQWVSGRWEQPRPGYTWHPHAWVQAGGHWHLQSGGWVRG